MPRRLTFRYPLAPNLRRLPSRRLPSQLILTITPECTSRQSRKLQAKHKVTAEFWIFQRPHGGRSSTRSFPSPRLWRADSSNSSSNNSSSVRRLPRRCRRCRPCRRSQSCRSRCALPLLSCGYRCRPSIAQAILLLSSSSSSSGLLLCLRRRLLRPQTCCRAARGRGSRRIPHT